MTTRYLRLRINNCSHLIQPLLDTTILSLMGWFHVILGWLHVFGGFKSVFGLLVLCLRDFDWLWQYDVIVLYMQSTFSVFLSLSQWSVSLWWSVLSELWWVGGFSLCLGITFNTLRKQIACLDPWKIPRTVSEDCHAFCVSWASSRLIWGSWGWKKGPNKSSYTSNGQYGSMKDWYWWVSAHTDFSFWNREEQP